MFYTTPDINSIKHQTYRVISKECEKCFDCILMSVDYKEEISYFRISLDIVLALKMIDK